MGKIDQYLGKKRVAKEELQQKDKEAEEGTNRTDPFLD